MARIYARKRGKAGSKKPAVPAKWVEYSSEEVTKLVVKLAKDKLGMAAIGLTLRDQYGIPSIQAVVGKPVAAIIAEAGLTPKLPEDLLGMLKQAVKLHAHMVLNKRDSTSKRGLELLESRIRRMVKYYIRTKKLPSDWKYNAERAKLIIQTES